MVDVLPNGNMIIAGKRCLTIAGEQRTLTISGVVRPIDLGPDNKINSTLIADLRTVYEGDGLRNDLLIKAGSAKPPTKYGRSRPSRLDIPARQLHGRQEWRKRGVDFSVLTTRNVSE